MTYIYIYTHFSDFAFVLKTVWCINMIALIMCQYDPTLDLKIKVGHFDHQEILLFILKNT